MLAKVTHGRRWWVVWLLGPAFYHWGMLTWRRIFICGKQGRREGGRVLEGEGRSKEGITGLAIVAEVTSATRHNPMDPVLMEVPIPTQNSWRYPFLLSTICL